jgi:glycosyltransferase involved in cell wall biosynthesis
VDLDVLMPFHRLDNFLVQAVDSIATNKNVNFRLIAIDDRLDQNTKILEIFRDIKKVEIVRTEGGTGYGNALKVGTRVIQAQATALMNSDDIVSPVRFSQQLNLLSNADLSITQIKRIDENNRKIPSWMGRFDSKFYDPIYLLFGSYGADASWCMRTSWWSKNSFFDKEDCLDWRIALKTFDTTKISVADQDLYFYRKHKSQITSKRIHSPEHMSKVYESWRVLASKYGFHNNSKSVFNFFATPWNKKSTLEYQEAALWVNKLNRIEKEIDPNTLANIKKLIYRRFILGASFNQCSLLSRFKFGLAGSRSLPLFLVDLSSKILK